MNLFCPSKGSFLSVPKDDLITLSFTVVVDAFRVVDRSMAQNSTLQHFETFRTGAGGWRSCFVSVVRKSFALYPVLVGLHHAERLQSKGHSNPLLVPIHIELSPTTVCFFITCGTLWSHRNGCCALFHHFAQQQAALPQLSERSGRTEWVKR